MSSTFQIGMIHVLTYLTFNKKNIQTLFSSLLKMKENVVPLLEAGDDICHFEKKYLSL